MENNQVPSYYVASKKCKGARRFNPFGLEVITQKFGLEPSQQHANNEDADPLQIKSRYYYFTTTNRKWAGGPPQTRMQTVIQWKGDSIDY